MHRRKFLGATAAAAAGSGLAAPALAQERITWDMVTSWPTGAPGLDDSARRIAQRITDLSGGRLVINVHGAGEIVPAFGVFDAVSQGVAQMYHSVPAYWISKNKAIGMFGSFPFGLTMFEHLGWMYWGGGQELYDKIYDGFGLKGYLAGGTGPQWFGWFRNEINTLDDLRGLRIRTTGFAGEMLNKVGVAVVTLPVELDASARAKKLLYEYNIVDRQELAGVNSVLGAAAWTYVVAALAAILELARWVFILMGRRN